MRADDGSYRGMVDAISNGAIDSSMEGTNARAVEGVNKYDSDTNGCDKGSGNDGSNDCAIHSPMGAYDGPNDEEVSKIKTNYLLSYFNIYKY